MGSVCAATCRASHTIHGGNRDGLSGVNELGEQGKREADDGRSGGGEQSTSFFLS